MKNIKTKITLLASILLTTVSLHGMHRYPIFAAAGSVAYGMFNQKRSTTTPIVQPRPQSSMQFHTTRKAQPVGYTQKIIQIPQIKQIKNEVRTKPKLPLTIEIPANDHGTISIIDEAIASHPQSPVNASEDKAKKIEELEKYILEMQDTLDLLILVKEQNSPSYAVAQLELAKLIEKKERLLHPSPKISPTHATLQKMKFQYELMNNAIQTLEKAEPFIQDNVQFLAKPYAEKNVLLFYKTMCDYAQSKHFAPEDNVQSLQDLFLSDMQQAIEELQHQATKLNAYRDSLRNEYDNKIKMPGDYGYLHDLVNEMNKLTYMHNKIVETTYELSSRVAIIIQHEELFNFCTALDCAKTYIQTIQHLEINSSAEQYIHRLADALEILQLADQKRTRYRASFVLGYDMIKQLQQKLKLEMSNLSPLNLNRGTSG